MEKAIGLSIEGGWGRATVYRPELFSYFDAVSFYGRNWPGYFLDPVWWQCLGKSLGWADSKYRRCEMKMPFYSREKMRGSGVITGESKDKKQWYVRWDTSKRYGARVPYPKGNIIETQGVDNWKMVWHRFIDHIAEGKPSNDFFTQLTQEK